MKKGLYHEGDGQRQPGGRGARLRGASTILSIYKTYHRIDGIRIN